MKIFGLFFAVVVMANAQLHNSDWFGDTPYGMRKITKKTYRSANWNQQSSGAESYQKPSSNVDYQQQHQQSSSHGNSYNGNVNQHSQTYGQQQQNQQQSYENTASSSDAYSKGAVNGQSTYGSGSEEKGMPYEFGWAVKDDASKNDYSHKEKSDGKVVSGSYRVLLPDGRTQVVTYRVEGDSGFVAEVTYEGEAKPYDGVSGSSNSYSSANSDKSGYSSTGSNAAGSDYSSNRPASSNNLASYSSSGSGSGAYGASALSGFSSASYTQQSSGPSQASFNEQQSQQGYTSNSGNSASGQYGSLGSSQDKYAGGYQQQQPPVSNAGEYLAPSSNNYGTPSVSSSIGNSYNSQKTQESTSSTGNGNNGNSGSYGEQQDFSGYNQQQNFASSSGSQSNNYNNIPATNYVAPPQAQPIPYESGAQVPSNSYLPPPPPSASSNAFAQATSANSYQVEQNNNNNRYQQEESNRKDSYNTHQQLPYQGQLFNGDYHQKVRASTTTTPSYGEATSTFYGGTNSLKGSTGTGSTVASSADSSYSKPTEGKENSLTSSAGYQSQNAFGINSSINGYNRARSAVWQF